MSNKKAPVHKIRPDVEYMPPDNYELPGPKLVVANDHPNNKFCSHERIRIFPYHRIIQCNACGATLDPFDYLLTIGMQENNQLSHLKYLKIQARQCEKELEKLKSEIKAVKKQTKP